MSFKNRLKRLKKSWQENMDGGEGYPEFPDGNYICVLTEAELKESKAGDLGIGLKFVVDDEDNEFNGKTMYIWCALETPHDFIMQRAISNLRKLGCEISDDPEEIEEEIVALKDRAPTVRLVVSTTVRKKDGKEFKNTDVGRLIDEVDEDEDLVPDVEEDEDEQIVEEEEVEETEADDDEDCEVLMIGDKVEVEGKGPGKVSSIDDENGLVMVKLDGGKRAIRAAMDKVTLIDDSE